MFSPSCSRLAVGTYGFGGNLQQHLDVLLLSSPSVRTCVWGMSARPVGGAVASLSDGTLRFAGCSSDSASDVHRTAVPSGPADQVQPVVPAPVSALVQGLRYVLPDIL